MAVPVSDLSQAQPASEAELQKAFARLRERPDDSDAWLVCDELIRLRVNVHRLRGFVSETLTHDEAWRSQAREVLRRTEAVASVSVDVQAASAAWLAAMLRNYIEQDEVLREGGAIVVQPPNDPQTVLVLQRGGNHLQVQVNSVDLVIS